MNVFFIFIHLSALSQQSKLQREMDSLEKIIYKTNKVDSVKIFKLSNQILKSTSSKAQKFRVLEKISESYSITNQTNKSIEYLFKAKEVAEEMDDVELMARAYGSIANQYSYLNLTEKANTYLNKAVVQIERLPPGNKRYVFKALSYIEFGNLYFNKEKFKIANENYRKSLREFNRIKDLNNNIKYHYRRSIYNIGNSYYYLHQLDSAEIYLKKALEVKDPNSPTLKYYIYSTLSEVYAGKKKHQRAIDTLQVVLKDTDFNINSLKSEIFLNLSKNYKEVGNYEKYAFYNEEYLKLRKELDGNNLKAIHTAFNAEQEDYHSIISDSKKVNKLLLFSIPLVVLGSVVLFFVFYRKKKQEKEKYDLIIQRLEARDVKEQKYNEEVAIEISSHKTSIPAAVEEKLLQNLIKFENSNKFTNQKFTVAALALYLKTNNTYVYEILNKHRNKNFNSYINELRINYICDKIHNNPEYLNYKISYLAEISGFTSHSAFATVFKNVTGIAPSVFLDQARKEYTSNV